MMLTCAAQPTLEATKKRVSIMSGSWHASMHMACQSPDATGWNMSTRML